MSYIEEFKSLILDYARDVQRYLSGDKSDYVYSEGKSEEHRTFDKNYENRARLCYALSYDVCEMSAADKKSLVRELFCEELKDRETNSFQGIGDNLEMLTSLLLELGEPSDSELFKRAKNANFDCACGYEPRVIKAQPLDEFSLIDCIYALSDLGETELMFRLTDEFKSGELDLKDLENLRSVAMWCTKRYGDTEFAVMRIYELFQTSPERFDSHAEFLALRDYMELLIKKGDLENAVAMFNEQRETFLRHKRTFYWLGARIIASGAESPETIWADILPYIEEDLGIDMVAPINRDIMLSAAELATDGKMVEKLRSYFDRRESEMQKIFD